MRKVLVLVCLTVFLFVISSVLISPTQAQGPIIGEIRGWAGNGDDPPDGWLWCMGQALSSTVYPELYTVITQTYGTGSGNPTMDFNAPDLLWRFPVGGFPGTTCGGGFCPSQGYTGGEADHTLTISEMPSHNHLERSGYGMGSGSITDIAADSGFAGSNYPRTSTTANTGGGQSHNNLPPYSAISFIIAYTTTNITPTPTTTPTITPTPTATLMATPVISVYTYTLDSGTVLTVPAQITMGQIIESSIGLGLLAIFVLTFTFRLVHRQ